MYTRTHTSLYNFFFWSVEVRFSDVEQKKRRGRPIKPVTEISELLSLLHANSVSSRIVRELTSRYIIRAEIQNVLGESAGRLELSAELTYAPRRANPTLKPR